MYNLYNKTQADLNEEERRKEAVRLAMDEGYKHGYQKGHSAGHSEGVSQGYAKGWADAMHKVKEEQASQQAQAELCEHEWERLMEPHKECVKCGEVRRDWAVQQHAEPPQCYAFKTCSSPSICAKAGNCVNTFEVIKQAEPVGDERAAFERVATAQGWYLGRDDDGSYEGWATEWAWMAWQARAAQSAQSAQRAGVVEGWDSSVYGYQDYFNAISAATRICGGAIAVSVSDFHAAMRRATPIDAAPTPAAKEKTNVL